MKLDDVVVFVEKFILDVIGVVLPGVVLLLGLGITANLSSLDQQWLWIQLSTTGRWLAFVSTAYVSGHLLHVLGENILVPILGWIPGSRVRTPKFIVEEAERSPAFSTFTAAFCTAYSVSAPGKDGKIDFFTARSLAMTIATDVDPLTYKFMFLSLMNLGVATASFVIGIVFVCNHMMASAPQNDTLALILLVVLPYLFLVKYSEFLRRALTVPFPAAIVKLLSSVADKTSVSAKGIL